jgi:hypothetical protein
MNNTLIPRFTQGQKVKAIGFMDCFGNAIPEQPDLIIESVKLVECSTIPSYYRVTARGRDLYCLEAAECFFVEAQ